MHTHLSFFTKDVLKASSVFSLFKPLQADKILDWSKLKQIADILKCFQNEKYVQYRVENIVRKGEIACDKQFLLFSQCFPHIYIFSASNVDFCVVIG